MRIEQAKAMIEELSNILRFEASNGKLPSNYGSDFERLYQAMDAYGNEFQDYRGVLNGHKRELKEIFNNFSSAQSTTKFYSEQLIAEREFQESFRYGTRQYNESEIKVQEFQDEMLSSGKERSKLWKALDNKLEILFDYLLNSTDFQEKQKPVQSFISETPNNVANGLLDELKTRLVRGEISLEEFNQIKKAIE